SRKCFVNVRVRSQSGGEDCLANPGHPLNAEPLMLSGDRHGVGPSGDEAHLEDVQFLARQVLHWELGYVPDFHRRSIRGRTWTSAVERRLRTERRNARPESAYQMPYQSLVLSREAISRIRAENRWDDAMIAVEVDGDEATVPTAVV